MLLQLLRIEWFSTPQLTFPTKLLCLLSNMMEAIEYETVIILLPTVLATIIAYAVYTIIYNIYFHPLANFPGPLLASTTIYWKAFVECIAGRSFCHELVHLHARYGEIS